MGHVMRHDMGHVMRHDVGRIRDGMSGVGLGLGGRRDGFGTKRRMSHNSLIGDPTLNTITP